MNTYEISIDSGSETFATVKQFATMAEAIAWARDFMSDWWRGAQFWIFCREDETWCNG